MVVTPSLDAVPDQSGQSGSGFGAHPHRGERRLGRPMRGVSKHGGQMLVQRSSEGDVDHLGAAADSQHGHPAAQGSVEQRELPVVPVSRGFVGVRTVVVPVGRRIDVAPTGDQYSVEAVQNPLGDARIDRLGRQQDGDPARECDPV